MERCMFKAIIVGAGMMAGGYDTPTSDFILSHAHAYTKHPDFELLGFFDIDFEKSKKMAVKWNCLAFEGKKNLPYADIISICTPDLNHISDCFEYARLNPQLIFMEKPAAHTRHEAEELKKINIPVLVNYSRRFSKEFQMLKKQIADSDYGKFLTGVGYYGKGTVHNGSHMIDLINWLISPVISYEVIDEQKDFYVSDTTKSMVLKLLNGTVCYMQGINCNYYTIFELDLLFEKGRIKINDAGNEIQIFKITASSDIDNQKDLYKFQTYRTDLNFALYNSLDNISHFLYKKENLLCTVNDAQQAIIYE